MFTLRRYTSADQEAGEHLHGHAIQQAGASQGRVPWVVEGKGVGLVGEGKGKGSCLNCAATLLPTRKLSNMCMCMPFNRPEPTWGVVPGMMMSMLSRKCISRIGENF